MATTHCIGIVAFEGYHLMASPQVENGYLKIATELWDALIRYRLPGEQRQIVDAIIRKTYGYNKKQDAISLSQFVKMTGCKKPNIIRSIKSLLSKKIIVVIKTDNKIAHVYKINKNYQSWVPLSKKKVFKDGSRTITIEDIKANVRKRDKNSCVICGHKDQMLPVHHIDYNQGNNDESNLLTLCKTCHGRTNSNYDYWKEVLSKKITDILLSKVITNVIKTDNPSLSKVIPTKDNTTKDNIQKTTPLTPQGGNCPYQKIVAMFHSILPTLPTVNLDETLKKRIHARWKAEKDRQTLEWWEWYFKGVAKCDFLMGKKKDFAATLFWLTGPQNMSKVLNGQYLNRQVPTQNQIAGESFLKELQNGN
jgi:phage replication O-like protein O